MHSFDAGYRRMFSSFSVTLIIIRLAFPNWGKEHATPRHLFLGSRTRFMLLSVFYRSPNKGRTETEDELRGRIPREFFMNYFTYQVFLVCITREGSLTRYIVLELELPFPDAGMWSAGRWLGPSPRRLRPFTAFFFF